MEKEIQKTTMNMDKRVHKRAQLWCVMHETDVTKLVNGLLADFMKGKRVR